MKKIEAEIKRTWMETHDVRTFRLEPEENIEFTPGQYCLVSIVGSDKHRGVEKPFTYANSPTRDYVELTIKRMGDFTTALHKLEQGEKLRLNGPRGQSLNFDESVAEDTVFIAGGSGITPFMSMIRYAIDRDLENRMTLIFSNRTEKDIIFREELERIDSRDGFKVVNTLTDNWPEDWESETGLIDRELLERHVERPERKLWYICGPPPMIDAMEELLLEMEVPEEKIRYESWTIPGKGG
ncbi:MAG: ferredoxin--NADP reductase [Candidatus Aenigmatarchaeota archaeon]